MSNKHVENMTKSKINLFVELKQVENITVSDKSNFFVELKYFQYIPI